MHEAEKYLKDIDKPNSLYIRYMGQKRRLFINNPPQGSIGIVRKGSKKMGVYFCDWDNITQIYESKDLAAERERGEKQNLRRSTVKRLQRHRLQIHLFANVCCQTLQRVSMKMGLQQAIV